MAAVVVKKIKPAMIGTIKVPNHNESLNINMDKEKIAARTMNERAYNKLILAMQGELTFEVVEDSTTNELPDGDINLAWMNLKIKYEPNTSQMLIGVKREKQPRLFDHKIRSDTEKI